MTSKILLSNGAISLNFGTQENLPLVVSFNKTLPNIEDVIDKHWYNLSIRKKLKKIDKKSFVAYERNKNLHQKSEATTLWKAKLCVKIMKHTINKENVHHASRDWTICSPCLLWLNNLFTIPLVIEQSVHHASRDWTIFAARKWNKLTY